MVILDRGSRPQKGRVAMHCRPITFALLRHAILHEVVKAFLFQPRGRDLPFWETHHIMALSRRKFQYSN